MSTTIWVKVIDMTPCGPMHDAWQTHSGVIENVAFPLCGVPVQYTIGFASLSGPHFQFLHPSLEWMTLEGFWASNLRKYRRHGQVIHWRILFWLFPFSNCYLQ